MEEIVEHLGEMIMEAVPALAVLAFLVSVQQDFKDGVLSGRDSKRTWRRYTGRCIVSDSAYGDVWCVCRIF